MRAVWRLVARYSILLIILACVWLVYNLKGTRESPFVGTKSTEPAPPVRTF